MAALGREWGRDKEGPASELLLLGPLETGCL